MVLISHRWSVGNLWMQLSQRKSTPRSIQTFFRLHMLKIREILSVLGIFFLWGFAFLFADGVGLARGGRLMCPGVQHVDDAWNGARSLRVAWKLCFA
jgi:hypothetical protein